MADAARPPLRLADARRRPGVAGVPSPCVGVCRMDAATGWCQGCWRTLDEIAGWGQADEARRLAIWAQIEARQEHTA